MGCLVHGVTKSRTWLSDFHITSLYSRCVPHRLASPATSGLQRKCVCPGHQVPAPLTCDRSLVNGVPRNFTACSITGSFAQTLGILAKHPLFTWDILNRVHVPTSRQPPFSVLIKVPFLLEQFWYCLESSLPFLNGIAFLVYKENVWAP